MKEYIITIKYLEEDESTIIRNNMKEQGISINNIANYFKVTPQYISNMLRGNMPLQTYLKNFLEYKNLYKFKR